MKGEEHPGFVATVWEKTWSDPAWFWTMGLTAYFFLVLLGSMKGPAEGDVQLYHQAAISIWHGQVPYRDFVLEYPPYVIPFLLPPGIFQDLNYYKIAFACEMLVFDALVKAVLLWLGLRYGKRMLLPLICFSVGCAFNHDIYLQRFDIIPTAICLVMVVAFWKQKHFLAGVLLALGVGVKLYPVLFLPPLLALAWRQRRSVRFMAGVAGGLLPLALLTLVMPWGRFLAFHTERGLQVESLYASILWLLHYFGLVEVKWSAVRDWLEITGPAAEAWLPYARVAFLGTLGFSTIFVTLAAWRTREGDRLDLFRLARLLLVPLLAFVAFNISLSPQYLIWLLVLAAVAAMSGKLGNILLIVLSAVVIPLFFPVAEYSSGLTDFQTLILVVRNLMLIIAWGGTMKEVWKYATVKTGEPTGVEETKLEADDGA